MRRAIACLMLPGLVAATVVAATKIRADRDPAFDFSTLKTWSWRASGPGEVKVWLTAESKSEPVQRQYEPVIVQAVEGELARRGWTKAAPGAPFDFTVTYYVLITGGSSSQQMGQFLPAVTQWGLPPFTAQTTAVRFYPEGTLVLDVAAPRPDTVVWRAVAQAEVELEKTAAQRTVRLQRIIKDVVAKLPRK